MCDAPRQANRPAHLGKAEGAYFCFSRKSSTGSARRQSVIRRAVTGGGRENPPRMRWRRCNNFAPTHGSHPLVRLFGDSPGEEEIQP